MPYGPGTQRHQLRTIVRMVEITLACAVRAVGQTGTRFESQIPALENVMTVNLFLLGKQRLFQKIYGIHKKEHGLVVHVLESLLLKGSAIGHLCAA